MEKFSGSYLNNLSDFEKQDLLVSSIPLLSGFESRAGNEGRVFFVSKDVIVKKYFPKIDNPEVLQKIFNIYCQECESFHKKGYNIPKIYTWSIIQRPDHTGFDYYLMEERVPGRELFISNIVKIYDEFKDVLPKNIFERAVTNPEDNKAVYEKILSSYVHDFIEMNERIESMSDKDLESFLQGIYQMFAQCKYAIPDVHARNVLFHQGKLNLIDLYLEKFEGGYQYDMYTPPEKLLLARMVMLFNYNGDIKNYASKDLSLQKINDEIELNEILCTEAMKKVIRAGKRICEFSADKRWWSGLVKRLEKILNKEHIEEVIKEIEPTIM